MNLTITRLANEVVYGGLLLCGNKEVENGIISMQHHETYLNETYGSESWISSECTTLSTLYSYEELVGVPKLCSYQLREFLYIRFPSNLSSLYILLSIQFSFPLSFVPPIPLSVNCSALSTYFPFTPPVFLFKLVSFTGFLSFFHTESLSNSLELAALFLSTTRMRAFDSSVSAEGSQGGLTNVVEATLVKHLCQGLVHYCLNVSKSILLGWFMTPSNWTPFQLYFFLALVGGGIKADSVGVITPYRSQVRFLKSFLESPVSVSIVSQASVVSAASQMAVRKRSPFSSTILDGIEINTVDQYQGNARAIGGRTKTGIVGDTKGTVWIKQK